jgi:predicted membrane protein
MEHNYNIKRKDEGRIMAGLILVIVGAALLLRNTGFPMPYWLFSWPMILILVGIYSGFKHHFRNSGWIVMIAIGGFFLADRIIPDLSLAPYFWPLLIIGLGIIFIIRPKRDKWPEMRDDEKKNGDVNIIQNDLKQDEQRPAFTTDSNDFLKVDSVFSGVQRRVVSKNFQGGKIGCVFGGADVDLTQSDINGTVDIKFEVVFGGAKIIIPPHWTVHNQIDGVFHGVDDKRKYNAAAGMNADKILVLRGSVVFGGVEIKSLQTS